MKYYECLDCGARFLTQGVIGSCGKCDGQVNHISVPQE